jgi:hypothetical protein
MIVIGAVLTLVLSFLVVIAVVVPRIKKGRKQKTVNKVPLSLPAPDTLRQKMKKEIENKWILSGKNWCEFYKSLGVTSSRTALRKYYPYEPAHPRHKLNFKNEEDFVRASVIYNFINNKKEEDVNVECRNETQ